MPPLSKAVRSAKRGVDIATVLVRYGFEDVLIATGIARLFAFRGQPAEHPDAAALPEDAEPLAALKHEPRAARLRQAMEELGPTFIKLGQVLSTRRDLIPDEWANEFKRLQSGVAGEPWELIEPHLRAQFVERYDELFKHVDPKPLAAASMAQVHRAELTDGTPVVLKILRPDIRRTIESDMQILETFAQVADRYFKDLGINLAEVVQEFAKELAKETDLIREGQNCDRLNAYFAEDETVSFPHVFWDATTRSVLAMGMAEGRPLEAIHRDNTDAKTLDLIMSAASDAVFRMCLEFGFFHADPHAGNIFADDRGRVTFIDCGMTGLLDRRTTDQLADLVLGTVNSDVDRVIRVVIALGDADPDLAEDRRFRNDIAAFISHFQSGSLRNLQFGALLNEFFELLRKWNVRCPSDLVFLIKALSTIEGVAEDLNPKFDLVSRVRPYIEQLVRDRYSPRALYHRLRRSATNYIELFESAPQSVRSLVNHLRTNKFLVQFELKKLEDLDRTIDHAARQASFSLIIASPIIGSSILILSERLASTSTSGLFLYLGAAGLIAAGTMAVTLFISMHLRRRMK